MVINPIREEEKMGPQKGSLRGMVYYRCGKVSHVSRERGLGPRDLSHGIAPALPPRDKPREVECSKPMDCSFGSALQQGGWEHPVVTPCIGDQAVWATLDTRCLQTLLCTDVAPKAGTRRAGPLTMNSKLS